jgi:hypothetical protein
LLGLRHSDRPLSRFGAKFFGKVAAKDLLQQRAGIKQTKDIANGHAGVDHNNFKEVLVRAVGHVKLAPSAIFMFAFGLPTPSDERRARSEGEVLHGRIGARPPVGSGSV